MTDYGLRCTNCDNTIKFEMDLEGIPKDDPSYGLIIKGVSLTCPTCGKRYKYLTDRANDFIVGGPDAIVQTPKVMLQDVISYLETLFGEYRISHLQYAIQELKKIEEKLPAF